MVSYLHHSNVQAALPRELSHRPVLAIQDGSLIFPAQDLELPLLSHLGYGDEGT